MRFLRPLALLLFLGVLPGCVVSAGTGTVYSGGYGYATPYYAPPPPRPRYYPRPYYGPPRGYGHYGPPRGYGHYAPRPYYGPPRGYGQYRGW